MLKNHKLSEGIGVRIPQEFHVVVSRCRRVKSFPAKISDHLFLEIMQPRSQRMLSFDLRFRDDIALASAEQVISKYAFLNLTF